MFDSTGDIFIAGTTNTNGYGADPKWLATTDDQVKDPAADFCPGQPYICGNGEAFVARLYNSASTCADDQTGDPLNGCSIDQLCPCVGGFTGALWKNHGKYVSCVAHASEDFLLAGLITEPEKDAIVSLAARSTCGATVKTK